LVSQNYYIFFYLYADQIIRHKARQLVGKEGFTEDDRADLEQELALDLLQRLPRFDPNKAKVTTFMTRVVEHRISTLLAARRAQCRDWRLNQRSLNAPVDDSDTAAEDLINRVADDSDSVRAMENRLDMERLLASLPDEHRQLCEQLKEHTMAESARILGLPRSTLYGRLNLIRECFAGGGYGR
jgi:RNA polymerase sigma-70 factor (ECF subfamily)